MEAKYIFKTKTVFKNTNISNWFYILCLCYSKRYNYDKKYINYIKQ